MLTWPCFLRYDPDILLGYEVQMHSWGYLFQRASALGVDLCQQLSRVPGRKSCHTMFNIKLVNVILFTGFKRKPRYSRGDVKCGFEK